MKTLVWPDVHHRVGLLRKVLENHGEKFEKRIFLGDWFDQFNDHPDHAKRTAEYLAELMEDPRNVFIEGNHDTSYRFQQPNFLCSGFTWDKCRFINSVLSYNHWEKFKLFEYEQGWLCSHAGVHPRIFEHPILGTTVGEIQRLCDQAKDAIRSGIYHPVYGCGKAAGGPEIVGGITWLRWYQFRPIPGLNQIVGHTIISQPGVIYARQKKYTHQGVTREWLDCVDTNWEQFRNMPPKPGKVCTWNWNIDTNNAHFAVIENGEVSIHLTIDYL
jgi:hypothetical protein